MIAKLAVGFRQGPHGILGHPTMPEPPQATPEKRARLKAPLLYSFSTSTPPLRSHRH